METFKIRDEYITIGQFLKLKGYISSGGEVKTFLIENHVFLNGEVVFQRGKKMHRDDYLEINQDKYKMI